MKRDVTSHIFTTLILLGCSGMISAGAQFNCKTPQGDKKSCLEGPVYVIENAATKAQRRVQNVVAGGSRWGLADENGKVIVKPVWVHVYPVSDHTAVVDDDKGGRSLLDLNGDKKISVAGPLSARSIDTRTLVLSRATKQPDGTQTIELLNDRGAVTTTITNTLEQVFLTTGHLVYNRRTSDGYEAVYVDAAGQASAHGQPVSLYASRLSSTVWVTGKTPESFDARVPFMFLGHAPDGLPEKVPADVIGMYPIFEDSPNESTGYFSSGWVIVREAPGGKVRQTLKVQEAMQNALTGNAQSVEIQSAGWYPFNDGTHQMEVSILHLADGKWGWYAKNGGVYSDGVSTLAEAVKLGAAEKTARLDALGRLLTLIHPTPSDVKMMEEYAASDYLSASRYAMRYQVTIDDNLIVNRICNFHQVGDLCARVNAEYYASSASNDKRIAQRNHELETWERSIRANHREPMPDLSYIHANALRNGAYGPSGGGATVGQSTHQESEVEIRQRLKQEACFGNMLRCGN